MLSYILLLVSKFRIFRGTVEVGIILKPQGGILKICQHIKTRTFLWSKMLRNFETHKNTQLCENYKNCIFDIFKIMAANNHH
jgi:hypothetical protein